MQLSSQIRISSAASSSPQTMTSPSVLLEFSNDSNKGLILPWVNGNIGSPSNGTIFLNTDTRKITAYVRNSFVDLSADASTVNSIDVSLQNDPNYPENINGGVIMGSSTSTARGVLVLESATKALVLPKVANPHLNIINPAAGMIVFDTVKELLCIYNGTQWSFIKKEVQ